MPGARNLLLILILSGLAVQTGAQTVRDTMMCRFREADKPQSAGACDQLIRRLKAAGHFTLSIDTLPGETLRIIPGPAYRFAVTGQGTETKRQSPAALLLSADSWLLGMENRGYPFASYSFAADSVSGENIYVRGIPETGPYCVWDSFETEGFRLSPAFMRRVSGIRMGQPASQLQLLKLRQKMAAADGVLLKSEPGYRLSNGRLIAATGLAKSRRDYLSALLGLATVPGGRPVLSGEADLRFYALFGRAWAVQFRWRSFRPLSQDLHATAEVPYIWGVPFITTGAITFEKLDTTFSRFRRTLALKFPAGDYASIDFGADFTSISGISLDASVVRNQRRLPVNPNSRQTLYFTTCRIGKVKGGDLPISGFMLQAKAGAGIRTLLRDARIAEITWLNSAGIRENIYDSLDRKGQLRQTQFRLNYQMAFYQSLRKNMVLALQAMGEEYRAPRVYFSELGRWGGMNSLRGFNEQSIFANSFHMLSAELRLMAGNSGYVAPFVAAARYLNESGSGGPADGWPFSGGMAAAVRTAAGVLRISWALGSDQHEPVKLSASKFHVGISSTF